MKKFLICTLLGLSLLVGPVFAGPGPSMRDAYNVAYISTATTTTIKSSYGILHTITVTGGTAGTIIVYDNTAASGAVIASFDSTNALETYTLDVAYSTGLTVITGAATKISVSYK